MSESFLPGEEDPASYQRLSALLEQHAVTMGASEIHGMVCGLLCSENIGGETSPNLTVFNDQAGPASEQLKLYFIQMMADLKPTLADGQLDFVLLLPDDESSLAERTESLATWCRGYLFGLVEGGLRDFDSLSAEANEMVHDMIAISEMEVEPADESREQQERNIAEIEEYIKIGVQFIYEELHASADTNLSSEQEP